MSKRLGRPFCPRRTYRLLIASVDAALFENACFVTCTIILVSREFFKHHCIFFETPCILIDIGTNCPIGIREELLKIFDIVEEPIMIPDHTTKHDGKCYSPFFSGLALWIFKAVSKFIDTSHKKSYQLQECIDITGNRKSYQRNLLKQKYLLKFIEFAYFCFPLPIICECWNVLKLFVVQYYSEKKIR